MAQQWSDRQLEILQAVERLLGHARAARLTTAAVAGELRASEAALYRHFPSKQAMFRALLEFAEDTVRRIVYEQAGNNQNGGSVRDPVEACGAILTGFMDFCQNNKGIARCLTREALHPDFYDLEDRVRELMDRLRLDLRQQLASTSFNCEQVLGAPPGITCAAMLASAEGVLAAWVREGMRDDLLRRWSMVWDYLCRPA